MRNVSERCKDAMFSGHPKKIKDAAFSEGHPHVLEMQRSKNVLYTTDFEQSKNVLKVFEIITFSLHLLYTCRHGFVIIRF